MLLNGLNVYVCIFVYRQLCFCYTDLCCTENDAYNIVDREKVVYEEIAR